MKTSLSIAMLALALAGCSSYSEIARWKSDTAIEGGEVPEATFLTQNFSYQFLWFLPICTGLPWTEGTDDIEDRYNVSMFKDEATIDGNLKSLDHALDLVGSRRISHLETVEDDSKAWSLFLVNRHEVRTKCIILKPEAPADPAAEPVQ